MKNHVITIYEPTITRKVRLAAAMPPKYAYASAGQCRPNCNKAYASAGPCMYTELPQAQHAYASAGICRPNCNKNNMPMDSLVFVY